MTTEREQFEAWLLNEQGLSCTWNEARNCYQDFLAHLAWVSWRSARAPLLNELADLRAMKDQYAESLKVQSALLHELHGKVHELQAKIAQHEINEALYASDARRIRQIIGIPADENELFEDVQAKIAELKKDPSANCPRCGMANRIAGMRSK